MAATGCLPGLNDPDYGPLTGTFAVSDIFSPSGFMGDGAKPGYLTVDFEETHCKQPRPPGAQGRCYSFTYFMDPTQPLMWAGVYWVFPTNSWGSRPGYAFEAKNYQQVRFYAAVETAAPGTKAKGGNTVFNALAGGINNMLRYGDPCNGPTDFGKCEHDDGWKATETFTVGKDIGPDFKQFHIPVAQPISLAFNQKTGAPIVPSELIGAFGWSVDFPDDACTCSKPGFAIGNDCLGQEGGVQSCPVPMKIYIDDIVWDTAPPPTTP